jgi:chromosome segregation ATPase
MDFDELFQECSGNTKYNVPKDPIVLKVDKLVTEIENNYQGLGTVYAEREKEKEELNKKVADAEKKLLSIKNPSNLAKMPAPRRDVICKRLAEMRDDLRKEILRCKVRLDEIKIESGEAQNAGDEEKKTTRKESKKEGKKENVTNEKDKKDEKDKNNDDTKSKWNMNPYSDFL